jgi:hypothetical protein
MFATALNNANHFQIIYYSFDIISLLHLFTIKRCKSYKPQNSWCSRNCRIFAIGAKQTCATSEYAVSTEEK